MPIEINGKTYLYPVDIAAHFGVDRNSVTQRFQRGTMPGAFKAGRVWLFPKDELGNVSFNKRIANLQLKSPSDGEWAALISSIVPDKLYSARAVADFFGFTPATISRHITTGGLPASRVQRGSVFDWQIKGADAIAFYAKKFNKPLPE